LKIRAVISRSFGAEFIYLPQNLTNIVNAEYTEIHKQDLKPLAESFYFSRQSGDQGLNGNLGHIHLQFFGESKTQLSGVSVHIDIEENRGKVVPNIPDNAREFDLHPATTKRWLQLLLNHPRIGPELRRQMK
jgi:hypothetical protein